VRVEDWTLSAQGRGLRSPYRRARLRLCARLPADAAAAAAGENGYSRKGPGSRQASYYYSQPQLEVSGAIAIKDRKTEVSGTAWLDHEWSSQGMAAGAVGWDWAGINLADGGALMVFRMRNAGGATLWAGGTLRDASGQARTFRPDEIGFTPVRRWRSPRTQAEYPVSLRVRAGGREFALEPAMDDQELDARASTGTVYWEGAVRAREGERVAGRGYLELTGYWKPLKL